MDIVDPYHRRNTFIFISVKFVILLLTSFGSAFVLYLLVDQTLSTQPFFSTVKGLMPIAHWAHMVRSSSSFLVGLFLAASAATLISFLINQVLLAAVMVSKRDRLFNLRDMFFVSIRSLRAFIAITCIALILLGLGGGLIHKAFSLLENISVQQEWSLWWTVHLVYQVRVILILLWFALVGTWSFNCKTAYIFNLDKVEDKRGYFNLLFLPFAMWRKHWVNTLLIPFLVPIVIQIQGGIYLYVWRQYPPSDLMDVFFANLIWMVWLLMSAISWVWLAQILASVYRK